MIFSNDERICIISFSIIRITINNVIRRTAHLFEFYCFLVVSKVVSYCSINIYIEIHRDRETTIIRNKARHEGFY